MKPFLIAQLRPEDEASDNEFQAFLTKGDLKEHEVTRIRLDQAALPDDLDLRAYAGVIVGGGPGCVSDSAEKKSAVEKRIEDAVLHMMDTITRDDIPFLGACYGIGILAHYLGASVSKEKYGEDVGAVMCHITEDGKTDPLLAHLPEQFKAFVGHKEAVQELPDGCVHLVSSDTCPYQMIRYGKNVYATQFHPEADSEGFETRIRIYKHKGYFPPEDAQRLIEMCHKEDVHVPEIILKNFISRYKVPA